MPISLTDVQFDALMRYANEGATRLGETTEFEVLRSNIEAANSIKHYTLLLAIQSLPVPAAQVGDLYPPGDRVLLRLTRPIARQDVDHLLQSYNTTEDLVLVTPDAAGVVGWSQLTAYHFEGG